jgi:hypothetical protein
MFRRFTLAALAAAFTACSEPTGLDRSATSLSLFPDELKKTQLVECPTDITETTTAVLLGGVLGEVTVGGHRITVPAGALLPGVYVVTLTAPASKYVEIEAVVNGLPQFTFLEPVEIVINYGRCTRSDIDHAPLQAWYINSLTKAPIENMGGVDDKVARTVTFNTNHFSGYAVAQ